MAVEYAPMKKIPTSVFWFVVAVAICITVMVADYSIQFNKEQARRDFERSNQTSESRVPPVRSPYPDAEDELAAQIKERKPITERNVAYAKAFMYKEKPADFIEFCDDLGFCFSYPKRWGTFSIAKRNVLCIQEEYFDITGSFSNADIGVYAESPFVTTYRKEKCIPKGMEYSYEDPHRDLASADAVFQVGNTNKEVGVWFKNESTMFQSYSSFMSLTAPTNDPLYSRITFYFTQMESPERTPQDIEDFMAMAHTFRLP